MGHIMCLALEESTLVTPLFAAHWEWVHVACWTAGPSYLISAVQSLLPHAIDSAAISIAGQRPLPIKRLNMMLAAAGGVQPLLDGSSALPAAASATTLPWPLPSPPDLFRLGHQETHVIPEVYMRRAERDASAAPAILAESGSSYAAGLLRQMCVRDVTCETCLGLMGSWLDVRCLI